MSQHPMDTPEVINNLFHVRRTPPHTHPDKDKIKDGFLPVDEEIKLGYRLYLHHPNAPILLYFHGNGEIASDYESVAPFYHLAGVSLLVVDFRGYGWSTGTPLTSRLLLDAQAALDGLDAALSEQGVVPSRPLFVMGRSLGSAPAIYVAMNNAGRFKGLILESGYADAPSLFARLGINIPIKQRDNPVLPFNHEAKMAQISLPLLVIHGAIDTLIPVTNGQRLYEAAASTDKKLLIIDGAGHNNLLAAGTAKYFDAIKQFIENHLR